MYFRHRERRDLFRQNRLGGIPTFQIWLIFCPYFINYFVEQSAQESLQVIDVYKTHLAVNRGIFGHVASRSDWFCPINRCNFKNSLKNPYHHLFVKLWALSQSSFLSKIIKFKYFSSSFCCCR